MTPTSSRAHSISTFLMYDFLVFPMNLMNQHYWHMPTATLVRFLLHLLLMCLGFKFGDSDVNFPRQTTIECFQKHCKKAIILQIQCGDKAYQYHGNIVITKDCTTIWLQSVAACSGTFLTTILKTTTIWTVWRELINLWINRLRGHSRNKPLLTEE